MSLSFFLILLSSLLKDLHKICLDTLYVQGFLTLLQFIIPSLSSLLVGVPGDGVIGSCRSIIPRPKSPARL